MKAPHAPSWPKRVPRTMATPVTALCDNLAIAARRWPDKQALVFMDGVLPTASSRSRWKHSQAPCTV